MLLIMGIISIVFVVSSAKSFIVGLIFLGIILIFMIAVIFLANKESVLLLYILTIVNLDFVKIPIGAPFPISADILFSVLISILGIFIMLTDRVRLNSTLVQKTYFVFLVITFSSVLFSTDFLISFKRWGRYFTYYVLMILIFNEVKNEVQLKRFLNFMLASAIVPCILGLYGIMKPASMWGGFDLGAWMGSSMYMNRIKSTLSNSNTFGLYLAIIISLTVIFFLDRYTSVKKKKLLFLLLLLIFPSLVHTYSIGVWVATIVAVGLILLLLGKWKWIFGMAPFLGFLSIWFIPSIFERLRSFIDTPMQTSLGWRIGLYKFSFPKFLAKPILGSGQGTFPEYVSYGRGFTQHQTWMGKMVETGLIGTIAFIVLLSVVFYTLWRQVHSSSLDDSLRNLKIGVFSIFCGLLVISSVTDPFDLPSAIIYFWTLVALVESTKRVDFGTSVRARGF